MRGAAFAWATIAKEALQRMLDRIQAALSDAKSASRMRLLAMLVLPTPSWIPSTTCCNRFIYAPKVPRASPTCEIAESIARIAFCALAMVSVFVVSIPITDEDWAGFVVPVDKPTASGIVPPTDMPFGLEHDKFRVPWLWATWASTGVLTLALVPITEIVVLDPGLASLTSTLEELLLTTSPKRAGAVRRSLCASCTAALNALATPTELLLLAPVISIAKFTNEAFTTTEGPTESVILKLTPLIAKEF
jgi:hypothetical protein